jgi:hypothetical protein
MRCAKCGAENPASKRFCGGFRTRNLLSGKLDVFINLPLKVLQSSPQAARVILGALLNVVYEARGQINGRMLFLLDEVARLGYMGILETARGTGRKYGINLCLLYQSMDQLTQSWGPQGRQAWFDAAYLRLFSHIQDYEAADYLSKACGEFTALGDSITEGLLLGPGTQLQLHPSLDQPATDRTPVDQARRGPARHALRRTDRPRPERHAPALRARNLLPPPRDGRSHQSQ